jgi:hypothetical protein
MDATDGTAAWAVRFAELARRLAPRFGRVDLRGRAPRAASAACSSASNKNSW